MGKDSWAQYIEDRQDDLVERLAAAVAIPSVSGDMKYRPDCHKMADWMEDQLNKLDVSVRRVELGKQSGTDYDLPPVLFGTYGSDPKKKASLTCYNLSNLSHFFNRPF